MPQSEKASWEQQLENSEKVNGKVHRFISFIIEIKEEKNKRGTITFPLERLQQAHGR